MFNDDELTSIINCIEFKRAGYKCDSPAYRQYKNGLYRLINSPELLTYEEAGLIARIYEFENLRP